MPRNEYDEPESVLGIVLGLLRFAFCDRFRVILSVLKQFVLLITYPKWLRLTGNEYVIDLGLNARRTVPVSNIYLET